MEAIKKIILSLLVLVSFSAFAQEKPKEEKKVKEPQAKHFTLTEGEAVLLVQSMNTARKALPQSGNISALEATQALRNFDSIQRVLIKQVDTTKNK